MKAFQISLLFVWCATAFAGEPTPFRVRTEVSPNGFEAFRFDPATKQFSRVETVPDPLAPHAELVGQALERVPSWLREDVHEQFRALVMSPIRVKGVTSMVFEDVNRDGKLDLVVVDAEKKIRAFLAPQWVESKTAPKLRVDADGKIIGRRLDKNSQKTLDSYRANIGAESLCALGDVTGDGRPDLVAVDKSGVVTFLRNTSLSGNAEFQILSNQFSLYFRGVNVGLAARPSGNLLPKQSGGWLVVGNKEGEMVFLAKPPPHGCLMGDSPFPVVAKFPAPQIKSGAIAPSVFFGREDKSGSVVIGCADGSLKTFDGTGWDEKYGGFDKINVGSFAAPAFGDLDGDGDWDLVVGNGAGELKVFRNLEVEKRKIEFEEITDQSPLGKIKVNHSASPALGDVNGDGKSDLLLGAQDGTLRLFLSPDYVEDKETFAGIRVGELSAPAFIDVNGDGKLDVVAGNARGRLFYYENVSTKERLAWVEKYSRDMSVQDDDGTVKREIKFAGHYYREREMLFGANGGAVLEDYAKLLRDCPKEYVDEIAFVIANTSAEVLRAMSRLGQSDILLENAKAIYEMAKQLKYVSLKEHGDYTTLELTVGRQPPDAEKREIAAGDNRATVKKELPRDIYYWWVVHPRIYHEIPMRVDASWWDTKPEARGMSRDDWLRHQPDPDPLKPTEKSTFWRASLPHDKSHGKTLLEVVKDAPTVRDAVERMNYWISNGSPEGFMRFGYITNDGQPNAIFKKAFGSCGEFSILSTALARSALVPTAMISKFGEDHQWMEFFDGEKWAHWDAAYLVGVDAPWVSNEERRHTNHLSAVFRAWGNDYKDWTTTTVSNPVTDFTQAGAGYTDTGSVTVTVRDARGRAVDGAMIVVHNNDGGNRNLVAWGYTDAKGESLFRLGGKPNGGYTFEVVSPYGQAGTELFHIVEGKSYSLDYQLTGTIANARQEFIRDQIKRIGGAGVSPVDKKNKRPGGTPMPPSRITVEVKINSFAGLLRPPAYFTSGQYAINDIEFFGAHQVPHPIENAGAVTLLVLDKENFEKFKQLKPFSVVASRAVCSAQDLPLDLPRREWFFVFVHLETQRVHHRLNLTFETAEPAAAQGSFATDAETTNDESRGEREIPLIFAQPPTREFKNVKIFQDDENDHLKKTGWILGPFRVVGKERFLRITSDSPTKDFDLDLYLYADKNGNGKMDGASELVGKSTTPHAKEEIFLHLPEDTTYWLYCHGCRMKTPFGLMNLELSFDYAPKFIGEYAPVGWVKERAAAAAKIQTPFEVDSKHFSVTHNGKDVTASCRLERDRFFFALPDAVREGEKQNIVVTAKDRGGNRDVAAWEFIVDVTPPELKMLASPEGKEVVEKFSLQIKATDNGQLASVTYQVDDGSPVAFPKEAVEAINVSVLSLADGEHKLTVKAADAAGNETMREMKFTVKNPPVAVESVSPADGAKISDDRPVIRVNLWSRAEIDANSVRMEFNGEDVTAKMRYIGSIKQALFIPPFLKRGTHTVSISFSDVDGNKIEKKEATFEIE